MDPTPLRLVLRAPLARRIREVSETAWPREACGLLEGRTDRGRIEVMAIHRCHNEEPDPESGYTIDPEAFLRLQRGARGRGRAIVGVWHSHPHGDPAPSARDKAQAWPEWLYLIAGVSDARMTALRAWSLGADDAREHPIVRIHQ